MAQALNRTQKIFANNPTNLQFGSVKAGNPVPSTDPDVLQALPAWELGYQGEVTTQNVDNGTEIIQVPNVPTMEEMNGVKEVITNNIAFIQQEGVGMTYNAKTSYNKNAEVRDVDGARYISLKPLNKGNHLTDTAFWEKQVAPDNNFPCAVFSVGGSSRIIAVPPRTPSANQRQTMTSIMKLFSMGQVISGSYPSNAFSDGTMFIAPEKGVYNVSYEVRISTSVAAPVIHALVNSSSGFDPRAWYQGSCGILGGSIPSYIAKPNVGFLSASYTVYLQQGHKFFLALNTTPFPDPAFNIDVGTAMGGTLTIAKIAKF